MHRPLTYAIVSIRSLGYPWRCRTEYSFLQKLFPLVVLIEVRVRGDGEEYKQSLLELKSTKLFCGLG